MKMEPPTSSTRPERPRGRRGRSDPPGWFPALACGLLPQVVGELADLGLGIAPVPAQGLEKGQLALLGPPGDRLGRDVQDIGHLGGAEVARSLDPGAGLALCHRASLSRVRTPTGEPSRRACGGTGLSVTLLGAVRTGRLLGLARAPTIARLGGFSSKISRRCAH